MALTSNWDLRVGHHYRKIIKENEPSGNEKPFGESIGMFGKKTYPFTRAKGTVVLGKLLTFTRFFTFSS